MWGVGVCRYWRGHVGTRHYGPNLKLVTRAVCHCCGRAAPQNLVRRLNVPLERGVAALLETGGHGGLAYSLVELGFGRVAVSEIEVHNVFTNLL
jgi:hypothetical protein